MPPPPPASPTRAARNHRQHFPPKPPKPKPTSEQGSRRETRPTASWCPPPSSLRQVASCHPSRRGKLFQRLSAIPAGPFVVLQTLLQIRHQHRITQQNA